MSGLLCYHLSGVSMGQELLMEIFNRDLCGRVGDTGTGWYWLYHGRRLMDGGLRVDHVTNDSSSSADGTPCESACAEMCS